MKVTKFTKDSRGCIEVTWSMDIECDIPEIQLSLEEQGEALDLIYQCYNGKISKEKLKYELFGEDDMLGKRPKFIKGEKVTVMDEGSAIDGQVLDLYGLNQNDEYEYYVECNDPNNKFNAFRTRLPESALVKIPVPEDLELPPIPTMCNHSNAYENVISANLKFWVCPDCKKELNGDPSNDLDDFFKDFDWRL